MSTIHQPSSPRHPQSTTLPVHSVSSVQGTVRQHRTLSQPMLNPIPLIAPTAVQSYTSSSPLVHQSPRIPAPVPLRPLPPAAPVQLCTVSAPSRHQSKGQHELCPPVKQSPPSSFYPRRICTCAFQSISAPARQLQSTTTLAAGVWSVGCTFMVVFS